MLRCLRLIVAAAPVALAVLLLGGPAASADPWVDCGPHSLEEKVVRAFPRVPSPAGPAGVSSELQCGNRYYGFRRIEPQWSVLQWSMLPQPGAAAGDWRAVADDAITRTLTTDDTPVHDARSDTWTYESPDAAVVVGPRGLVIDARPAGR